MNVLIIEDNADVLDLVTAMVRRSEHVNEVVGCGSLREGLQQAIDPKFSLVLLDLMLGDGNGEQVIELIAKRRLLTRVIVMSAAAGDRLASLGKYWFVQVMPKPFSTKHFDYLTSLHE